MNLDKLANGLMLTALMTLPMASAIAQTLAKIGFESVGRAWPLAHDLNGYHMTGATLRQGRGVFRRAANHAPAASPRKNAATTRVNVPAFAPRMSTIRRTQRS